MEFIMNEQGCQSFCEDTQDIMKRIAVLVSDIESQNNTLKAALGDDYEGIAMKVKMITSELGSAQLELNAILQNMTDYISKVGQTRYILNGT